jgi:tetratricopeptide (TPR) repeat protein
MKTALRAFELAFCLGLLFSAALAQSLVDEGKKLFDAKRYDEAKAKFDQALLSNSNDAPANYFLGRVALHFGDFDLAQKCLEKAVALDEGNIDYHLWLASVYSQKARRASFLSIGRWAGKWKAELEGAFAIDPKHIEARKRLISYYLNAPGIGGGDKEKGKRLAEETIKLDEVQGRLLLANAFSRTGKSELAIAEYKKVLELDSQNGAAYNSMGYIFLEKKDYAAAKLNFRKYTEVAPDDPNAYDSFGDYYAELKKIDEAMTLYQKALEIDSTFSTSRFKLAEAYEEKKMPEKAIYHYEKLIVLSPADSRAEDAGKRLKKLKK